jgi:WD repeat-containing protein 23
MRLSGITLQDLARLMSVGTTTRVGDRVHIQPDDDEDYNGAEDDDNEDYINPRASAHQWYPPVSEPQKAGLELLASGDFGRVGVKARSRRNSHNILKPVLNKFYHPLPLTSREDLQSVRDINLYVSYSSTLYLWLM